MKDTPAHRVEHRAVHQGSFHTWDAILAFPSISPGKDTPPYPVPETEDTFHEMQHEISDIRHQIEIISIINMPQNGCPLCFPVLAAALGGEKNHRRAVLFMG